MKVLPCHSLGQKDKKKIDTDKMKISFINKHSNKLKIVWNVEPEDHNWRLIMPTG